MIEPSQPLPLIAPSTTIAPALSIRRQLLKSIFVSMFILLTVFSTAVIWLTQEGASRLIIDNAQQVTHALAQQSTLALLTESYENAEKALKEVMAFPDVVGAGLVSTQGKLLGWQGEDAGRAFILSHQWGSINEKLFFDEQTDYWHIAYVVILSGSQQ